MPIKGGLTKHLYKRPINECSGHIEDFYIFNIPKFTSWKYFCFLEAATNWECKTVGRNWTSVSLKLKYNLQRNVFNVERFHQHCWSLNCKAIHISLNTEGLQIHMKRSFNGSLWPNALLRITSLPTSSLHSVPSIQTAGFGRQERLSTGNKSSVTPGDPLTVSCSTYILSIYYVPDSVWGASAHQWLR